MLTTLALLGPLLLSPDNFSPAKPAEEAEEAMRPTETVRLFDGKDFREHFVTWLAPHGHEDPDKVFTVVDQVDGAPAIRVSGQHFGGLLTKRSYRDYRLVVEYRWGLVTWGGRKGAARDNGVLLHCQGRAGNVQKDFKGPWMRSVELQIIEGGVGDLLLVPGHEPDGTLLKPRVTVRSRKDRDGEWVFDPEGEPREHEAFARVNWWGRDDDWADKLGVRGPRDADSPPGEWTRVEAVCDGGAITYHVNGKLVNQATRSSATEGRILLQSEGAEIYFRRVDLEPLAKARQD